MNCYFICLYIAQLILFKKTKAVYNKDVTCIIDTDKEPVCTTSPRQSRRTNINELPSHDPYIPRNNTLLFNCSVECKLVSFNSIVQLVSPNLNIKSCFTKAPDTFECEPIRYHYLKNLDKVLFLSKNIPDKNFYTVDCLIYSGGERVCHKKDYIDNINSHANLVDTGALARPKETSILAQDEFICEESNDKEIHCDLNSYVPFDNGLKLKETMQFGDSVLLKSGSYVVILNRKCVDAWCGYSGRIKPTRRLFSYRPPGGKVYRCYYAKKQQICKEWYALNERSVYNQRGWLSS